MTNPTPYLIHTHRKNEYADVKLKYPKNKTKNVFLNCDFVSHLLNPKPGKYLLKYKYSVNPYLLYEQLYHLKHKAEKITTHKELHRLFYNFFKYNYPKIKFRYRTTNTGYRKSVFVGGEYCLFNKEVSIVYMVDKEFKDKGITFNSTKWNNLIFSICEVLCHELIHYTQHVKAGDKIFSSKRHDFSDYIFKQDFLDECEYLSEDIELEAFAHTAVIERLRYKKLTTELRMAEMFYILEANNCPDNSITHIKTMYYNSKTFWESLYLV